MTTLLFIHKTLLLTFYFITPRALVSIKSILSSSKNGFYKGSRKAILFESTSRNFVMERFLYFYYLCLMPQYDFISCFIKANKFRVSPSPFFVSQVFLRLNRREHAAWLRSCSCNFLIDFLHTWIPHATSVPSYSRQVSSFISESSC